MSTEPLAGEVASTHHGSNLMSARRDNAGEESHVGRASSATRNPVSNGRHDVEEEDSSDEEGESQSGDIEGVEGEESTDADEEEEEEEEEEEDDDEEEEEPALKYELLGGSLPDLLQRDSASTLAVSPTVIVSRSLSSMPLFTIISPEGNWDPLWTYTCPGPLRQTS